MATIFKQANSKWAKKKYPNKCTVGGSGCGLVSVTNLLNEYEKYKDVTPLTFYSYMVKGAVDGDGTKRAYVATALTHYGFKDVQRFQSKPISEAWKLLAKGYRGVFVMNSNKAGSKGYKWTTSGHYVAVTDYKVKNGKHYLYVKDSSWRNHDGWLTYEEHMRGAVSDCIIGDCSDLKDKVINTTTKQEKAVKNEIKAEISYTEMLPTTKLVKSNAQVIADTITWLKWHANDNSFHYGYTSKDKSVNAHHNGCYYCGTNTLAGGRSKKGILDYEKTYCCNPFIHAGFAHGGCVPTALTMCRKGTSWDFHKGKGYDKSALFIKIAKPSKIKDLPIGAVLCRDTHVAMYIGDGKIVHACHSDDNKRNSEKWNTSIQVEMLSDSNYRNFPRVYKFNGSVNTTSSLTYGEVSDRVELWQKFLNWYFGKKVVATDRCYGDATFKYTKLFQETEIGKGQGDGYVGNITIGKAKSIKK